MRMRKFRYFFGHPRSALDTDTVLFTRGGLGRLAIDDGSAVGMFYAFSAGRKYKKQDDPEENGEKKPVHSFHRVFLSKPNQTWFHEFSSIIIIMEIVAFVNTIAKSRFIGSEAKDSIFIPFKTVGARLPLPKSPPPGISEAGFCFCRLFKNGGAEIPRRRFPGTFYGLRDFRYAS